MAVMLKDGLIDEVTVTWEAIAQDNIFHYLGPSICSFSFTSTMSS
jgi:hypothetical protein